MREESLDSFRTAVALLPLIIVPELLIKNLVQLAGMSLSPLGVVERHAINSSRLFASILRDATRRYYRELL